MLILSFFFLKNIFKNSACIRAIYFKRTTYNTTNTPSTQLNINYYVSYYIVLFEITTLGDNRIQSYSISFEPDHRNVEMASVCRFFYLCCVLCAVCINITYTTYYIILFFLHVYVRVCFFCSSVFFFEL